MRKNVDDLLPYFQVFFPYVCAGAVSFCLLLASGEPISLRKIIGTVGLKAIVGGTISPILTAVAPIPKVPPAAQNLGIAVAIGADVVNMQTLGALLQRILGGGKNAGDQ